MYAIKFQKTKYPLIKVKNTILLHNIINKNQNIFKN